MLDDVAPLIPIDIPDQVLIEINIPRILRHIYKLDPLDIPIKQQID